MTTYTVTTAVDELDATADHTGGAGVSLREAIDLANGHAGSDVITFAPVLSGATIQLGQGQLVISGGVSIRGDIDGNGTPDITVDASLLPKPLPGEDFSIRVFEIQAGASSLRGLVITGGHADTGGGVLVSGGSVTIRDSVLIDNEAGVAGGGIAVAAGASAKLIDTDLLSNTVLLGPGGGAAANGTFTVTGGTLDGNDAASGGGIAVIGGTVTLTDVILSQNNAGSGGGLYNQGGTATLNNVEMFGNIAGDAGGGIYNRDQPGGSAGTLVMTGGLVFSNSAGEGGGFLFNFTGGSATVTGLTISNNDSEFGGGIYNVGELKLANVTLDQNRAQQDGGSLYNYTDGTATLANMLIDHSEALEGDGGGIFNEGVVHLANATFAGNRAADQGGGLFNSGVATVRQATFSGNSAVGGGIYNAGGGGLTVANSIVAGNDTSEIFGAPGGSIVFAGQNIIQHTLIDQIFASVAADPLTGVTSGVLASNGGPVATIRIKTGGLAHNAGTNAGLPSDLIDLDQDGNTAETIPFDARGATRVVGTVDIGAMELQVVAVAVDDDIFARENAAEDGSVFRDNDHGADINDTGAAVTAVNGVAANVGATITLPSGARVRIKADGSLTYNPNHAFDALADFNDSGASNTTATDSFTYTLAGGSTATVTMTIYGVDSDDLLRGTAFADLLTGRIGNDTLDGGTGADTMRGGPGNDTYLVDVSGDRTIELADAGIDTVMSSISRALSTNIENLRLQGAGNINGNGNELNNKIIGSIGANILKGLAGNDTIEGKDGADTIEGGEGDDTLSGGGQGDVFRFATSNTGVDRILDFSKNGDRFDLSGGTFSAIGNAANGDTVLTHAGGFIRVQNPPNLTLAQWNALVLTSSGKAAVDEFAAGDTSGTFVRSPFDIGSFDQTSPDARNDMLVLARADWAFA